MANNQGIRYSKTSPAFLHANSTSHTWIFSAIAELIDNAYDPDVGAKTLAIDVLEINNVKCLTFKDDGAGLDLDLLHKMLSFGYCDKAEINGIKPIGHYGNGFKSGSMRLGKDAVVFTKQKETMSVGFLSQTYLKQIGSDSVIVPIVSWNTVTRRMLPLPQMQENLKAIISYSIFKNAHSLLQELLSIDTKTGTKIVIYNLNRYHSLDGTAPQYELDFMSDRDDILNPEMAKLDAGSVAYEVEYKPKYRKSLREYCSILFLKPRLRIIIRGKKVKTKLISQSLSNTESDSYRPRWLDSAVPIIFGFSPSRDEYGMMMYHRNRLIKAFERVGCQKEANVHGVGVIGVIEADFLTPIHNKQDFNKTDKLNALMVALASKLNDYWFEKKCRPESAQNARGNSDNYFILNDAGCIIQDWYWAQCDKCLKWRRLPDGLTDDSLPDKWYCRDNPDKERNTCEAAEENIDSGEADVGRASYDKTVKKKKEEEKRIKKAKEEADKRHSLSKMAQMQRENAKLKKKMIEMEKNTPLDEEDEGKGDEEIRECKPTVADLEAAQKELNEAKKREMKQHLVIRKMQKERKSQDEKESSLKKLCTKAGKKLKKIKDIAPDVVRSVMQDGGDSDGDDDCITLDSDDEGIDFTDPKWMEEFLTDDDRARDVKPNLAELDKSIDDGKRTTENDASDDDEATPSTATVNGSEPEAPTPIAMTNGSLSAMDDLFSASDNEDDAPPPLPSIPEDDDDDDNAGKGGKDADAEEAATASSTDGAAAENDDAAEKESSAVTDEAAAEGDGDAEKEAEAEAPSPPSSPAPPAEDDDDDANEGAPEPMDDNDDDDAGAVEGGADEEEEQNNEEDEEDDKENDDGGERRKSGRIQKGEEEKEAKADEERKQKEQMEKEKAKEEKRLEKEREKQEREKEKELERERKEKEKEKERIAKEKEKERLEKEKEKERERKEKEREKERIAKEKEKERLEREKEKERERIEREKEKERERREKEREKERLEKLKEKEKREKEKEKERKRKEREKEKERLRKEKEKEKERKLKEKEAEKERKRIEREERKKKAEEEGKEVEEEEEQEEEEEEEEAEEEGPESEADESDGEQGGVGADEEENDTTDDVVDKQKENTSSLSSSSRKRRKTGDDNNKSGGDDVEKDNDDDNKDDDDDAPEKKKPKGSTTTTTKDTTMVEDDKEDKSEDLLRFVDEKTKENSSLKTQVSTLENKLKELRANVSELIKIIVPDVDVEAMLIDDLVRQVILENKTE